MALDIDQVLEQIGSMGRYQIRFISAMCYLGFFVSGFQTMIMTFIATEPGWRCVTNSTLCNATGVYRPGDVGYNDRCDRKLPSSEWEYEDTFTSTVTEVCTGQFEISRPHPRAIPMARTFSRLEMGLLHETVTWYKKHLARM